jgi:hypothetical protein
VILMDTSFLEEFKMNTGTTSRITLTLSILVPLIPSPHQDRTCHMG